MRRERSKCKGDLPGLPKIHDPKMLTEASDLMTEEEVSSFVRERDDFYARTAEHIGALNNVRDSWEQHRAHQGPSERDDIVPLMALVLLKTKLEAMDVSVPAYDPESPAKRLDILLRCLGEDPAQYPDNIETKRNWIVQICRANA